MPSDDKSSIKILYCEFNREKICTTILWTVGMMLLATIMALHLQALFYEYTYNNLSTRMTIVPKNETITPPKLTICIPYSPMSLETISKHVQPRCIEPCPDCEQLAKNGFPNISSSKENLTLDGNVKPDKWNMAGFLFQDFMKKGNFDILDPGNADWNQAIVEAVWDAFTCIGDMDNDSTASNHQCIERYNVNVLLEQKQLVQDLWGHLINFLCGFIQIEDEDGNKTACADLRKESAGHMFRDRFCFPLDFGPLKSPLVITVDSRSPQGKCFNALEDESRSFEIYYGHNMLLWPLGTPETSHLLVSSDTGRYNLLKGHEQIIFKYMIQNSMYDRQRKNCYKDPTPLACEVNCKDERRIECFECVPFTFRSGEKARRRFEEFPDTPYCNDTLYSKSNCNHFEVECRSVCQNPCKYISYQWLTAQTLTPGHPSRKFTLKILAIESPYMRFELVERQTYEQFVSNIAGYVNLFLGFSGATVVGLLIQLIAFFKKWKIAKLENGMLHTDHESDKHPSGQRVGQSDVGATAIAQLREVHGRLGKLEGDVQEIKKKFDRMYETRLW